MNKQQHEFRAMSRATWLLRCATLQRFAPLLRCAALLGLVAGCCWMGRVSIAAEQTLAHNQVLKIGDAAPAWQDLPGVDGKTHSLSDHQEEAVLVVVFTCNSCPYAVDYQDRILALAKKYADQKVSVVAINVNTVPEDRLDAMKERAEEKGFTFSYLYDESQKIARDYGASFTPEFFVLNQQRQVTYMGAMDDNTDPAKATVNYVALAVEAALAGKTPEVTTTVPVGCRVRWARTRRERPAAP